MTLTSEINSNKASSMLSESYFSFPSIEVDDCIIDQNKELIVKTKDSTIKKDIDEFEDPISFLYGLTIRGCVESVVKENDKLIADLIPPAIVLDKVPHGSIYLFDEKRNTLAKKNLDQKLKDIEKKRSVLKENSKRIDNFKDEDNIQLKKCAKLASKSLYDKKHVNLPKQPSQTSLANGIERKKYIEKVKHSFHSKQECNMRTNRANITSMKGESKEKIGNIHSDMKSTIGEKIQAQDKVVSFQQVKTQSTCKRDSLSDVYRHLTIVIPPPKHVLQQKSHGEIYQRLNRGVLITIPSYGRIQEKFLGTMYLESNDQIITVYKNDSKGVPNKLIHSIPVSSIGNVIISLPPSKCRRKPRLGRGQIVILRPHTRLEIVYMSCQCFEFSLVDDSLANDIAEGLLELIPIQPSFK